MVRDFGLIYEGEVIVFKVEKSPEGLRVMTPEDSGDNIAKRYVMVKV